jgi:hypothetical protein
MQANVTVETAEEHEVWLAKQPHITLNTTPPSAVLPVAQTVTATPN